MTESPDAPPGGPAAADELPEIPTPAAAQSATAVHVPTSNGWWQRNRWAILVLPLVLAIVAISGAGRILMFWWPNELTDRVEGELGSLTTFSDEYRDVNGFHTRAAEVGVLAVRPDVAPANSQGEPVTAELTPGTRLWEVEIRVEAAPDTVLTGCVIALVDAQGRVTERDTAALSWDAGYDGCQPPDSVNPSAVLYEGMPTESSTRPPGYTRTAQLLTAEDFEPVEVRVWWEPPTFLAVPLPDAAR